MENTLYDKLSYISQQMSIAKIPNELYHYTSIKSIENIISSKEIWLTHFDFLNDPNEIKFGFEVLKYIIKGEEIFKEFNVDILFEEGLKKINENSPIFILSLTTEQDSLSQWFSYGDRGRGTCITINESVFRNLMGKENFKMASFYPVHYYEDLRSESVFCESPFIMSEDKCKNFEINLIESLHCIYDEYKKTKNKGEVEKVIIEIITVYSSLIKNDFFKEEKEIRFVIIAKQDDKSIQTNTVKDGLKAIYKLKINNYIENMIDEILLGPLWNGDKTIEYAMNLLLNNNKLNSINVSFSKGSLKMK